MDTTNEHNDEPTTEPAVDNKKEKKLSQLAAARESAKAKKRQRDEDLSMMKETLNNLTSLISSKKAKVEEGESDDEEPVKKQKRPTRITKEPDETEAEVSKGDTWTTSAIRSSALMGLAAASFYFSNIYGKQQQRAVQIQKKVAPVHINQPNHSVPKARGIIGQSGFCM